MHNLPYSLLAVFLLPTLGAPLVYLAGKKSPKIAALLVALISLINIGLVLTTVPTIMDHSTYTEQYGWIPVLNADFTLFADGISASIAIISLLLVFVSAIFSIKYMEGKKNLPVYYALLSLLSVGLVGVFITSNLLLFYFCWELMLVPAYFIIGGWGYRESYRAAFKFFVFTHAGAVFVLLGIGAIYMVTGATDITTVQAALMNSPDIARWILLALTAGFAVKMAVVPVHMWLPDAHSEAPATMSALLSGVIISAGAYAILRLSLGTVFPAIAGTEFAVTFLHGLAVFGVITAFFGAFISLVETDIKRIIAFSSIAHMGYIMFGLSLYPANPLAGGMLALTPAIVGTVLHILTHGVSKGLLFLSAGSVMHQTEVRDIRDMGGLAWKMPFTGASSIIAALSIAGSPPFACFISEFLIFVGAFEVIQHNQFYLLPTVFMLIATVLSLAYSLRFIYRIFLSQSKTGNTDSETANTAHHKKIVDVPNYMKLAMLILIVFVVILGVYPTFFINLINTVGFI
ncbi:MAG: NADH-quinone oxidoreductase subunit M [Candidatus Bathyarchaeota archaeon]|nr:NADH-quinone oxidoreductase subunit M [Candidatus Bathyarchaeota archaeon]